MPSFDTVLEPNAVELHNAVDQANKEIGTRFDFKLAQVRDVLVAKLAKRGVDVRYLHLGAKVEKAGGDKVRQVVPVKVGIDPETGKRIQQLLKGSKLKVQAAYQGDTVRVSGAKRDELQAAIALIRREVVEWP